MNKMVKVLLAFFVLVTSFLLPFSASTVSAEDGSALERVQEAGVLRVGTSADYPPFEFYATVDGERTMVGMDVSIAQNIAEDLGVELEMVDMGFDALIPALESGNIDMIAAGMVPTPEREESLDFSQIYYEGSQNLVIRAEDEEIYDSLDSLEGQTVGVQAGSLQAELVGQIPDVEPLTLENINDLILALQTNRVEALVLAETNAEMHALNNDGIVTFNGGFDYEDIGNALAFRQNEDSLVAAVDESLSTMLEEGQIDQYFEEAVALTEEESERGVFQYWDYFLDGTLVTLLISALGVFFGLIFGSILALMRLAKKIFIRWPATWYVEFIRGTPLMIQVMIIYFGLGNFYSIPALTAGIIAVSLNSAAYVCEIIRGGLNSVNKGQTEASRSLGMSRKDTLRHIVFPQALKNIWPALGNEFIVIIKESSIVSVIGVGELIFQSRNVRAITYQGIVPLFVVMVIYFILTFTLTKLLNYYEGKMNYDKR
jgi:polar amino acid transport system substrate-binding protein